MSGFRVDNGEIIREGIWVGDVIVSGVSGKRYKVTKINPKNFRCLAEDGQEWNINRAGARKAEDQTWDGPKEKTPYEKLVEAIDSGIVLGTAVKLKGVNARKYPGTYVVIDCKSDGTFRVAKLGGDGNRYLRKLTTDSLEVVQVNA